MTPTPGQAPQTVVSPAKRPRPSQIPSVAWSWPLGLRHPEPAQDKSEWKPLPDDGPWGGVPLGGFGSGSIGRTPRGDFARWHLDVGQHRFLPLPANMFSVFIDDGQGQPVTQALWTETPASFLSAWQWNYPVGAGRYYALFPKAWYVYDHPDWPLRLVSRQFSPIIPHDYQATSYPVGIIEWAAENTGDRLLTVGLMFTWQHLVGLGVAGGVGTHSVTQVRTERLGDAEMQGIVFTRDVPFSGRAWDGEFAIAALAEPGVVLSHHGRFLARGDGADIWADFAADGALDNSEDETPARATETGAGLAATFTLQPGESKAIPFVVAWDLPVMQFGEPEAAWYRRYTKFFGRSGRNAWTIAKEGLQKRDKWEAAIDRWHQEVLAADRPDWYKAALFNELYYLVDGGTAWEAGRVGQPPEMSAAGPDSEVGRFTYLETFIYDFYSTLDVRFYASWALLLNWPKLELQVMRQFISTVGLDDPTPVTIGASGEQTVRKLAGALPHDLGAPTEAPWDRPNAYAWQDVNIWKDLNTKFVLLIWRDYVFTGDRRLLEAAWPGVQQALTYLGQFDRDGDGIPENDGLPDQTYDTWPMKGLSAYCGGLWLAALEAAVEMGQLLGDDAAVARYTALLETGKASYQQQLWTGRYYLYDTAGEHHDSIMADQLAGQWYAYATHLPPIVPAENVRVALQTVFDNNVQQFAGGEVGAVNGMRPDGTVDRSSEQSQEVWVGISYALAALMLHAGLDQAAWRTAWGVVNTTYETKGLWFRTPEAWDIHGNYRAPMYMRPQAIWAIEHALRMRDQ